MLTLEPTRLLGV